MSNSTISSLLGHPAVTRLAALAAFSLVDNAQWEAYHYAMFVALILAGLGLLSRLTLAWGRAMGYDKPELRIKPGGKVLERFELIDLTFITCSQLMTAMFTYHALRYCWTQGTIVWGRPTLGNSLLALPLLYAVYDFFYTFFHRALHHRSVYAYVHKHHHRQIVPTRGSYDAINVHPFEFIVGEYDHLLSVHLVALFLQWLSTALPPQWASAVGLDAEAGTAGVHVGAMWFFIVFGGVLASLNHTRYDVTWLGGAFSVRYHDIHHARFNYNYAQYIPLWDILGRSFMSPAQADGKKSKAS